MVSCRFRDKRMRLKTRAYGTEDGRVLLGPQQSIYAKVCLKCAQ